MRVTVLFALLLALGACHEAPQRIAHPPMWEVTGPAGRLVLVGSVHELPPSLDWLRGPLAQEVSRADSLLLELSPAQLASAPALVARMAYDEPVPPLGARLAPAQAAIARRMAVAGGVDAAAVDSTESWALTIAVSNASIAGSSLSPAHGVEAGLTAAFRARGRPVEGLELATTQLAAFDDLSPANQDVMLSAAIDEAPTAVTEADAIVDAWARGDADALARLAAQSMAPTPALIEPLVLARNRAWAAALVPRLNRPGDTMVAVGVGHLVGPGSLPALLAARGFHVRRLDGA